MKYFGKTLAEIDEKEFKRDTALQMKISEFVFKKWPKGVTRKEIESRFHREGSSRVREIISLLEYIDWIVLEGSEYRAGNSILAHKLKIIVCRACGSTIPIKGRYHAGFGDEAFLYCNKDPTVLTISAFNRTYLELAGIPPGKPDYILPWTIIEDGRRDILERIERNLLACPCGGEFLFSNPLGCPNCGNGLSRPLNVRSIYYIVIDRSIDSETAEIWKSKNPRN